MSEAAAPISAWDPALYNKFSAEREQPFWDLVGLIEPVDAPRVVDLGCGDGRLTEALHNRLAARDTVGVDTSSTMLDAAQSRARADLTFKSGNLADWQEGPVDIVLANASLHWVPDHADVIRRWRDALAEGGQLAVQMPANADHPSHRVSSELAREWWGEDAPSDPVAEHVLAPETYAELLAQLGFERQHVRLQVYLHRLATTADVVEWVKGTSLTRFKSWADPDEYERFVEEYRSRLLDVLGRASPYFYPFKRILLWGRLPGVRD